MALVKDPLGGSAASGTMSGKVFARNRAGNYVRAWAKPVNPGTVRQAEVRAQFGMASTDYGMLAQSEIEAWQAYASLLTRLNRLGEAYTPTGRQIFMETAQNLRQIGVSPLSSPGPTTDVPAIEAVASFTVTETGGVIDAFDIGAISGLVPSGGDGSVVVEASPVYNPSRHNVNNLYRQIGTIPGPLPIAGPTDFETEYEAVFGDAAVAGQLVTLRAKVVDELTGFASPWYYIKGLVA